MMSAFFARAGPLVDGEVDAQLVVKDGGEGGLAQARGAVEEDVRQGLAAAARGFERDGEAVDDLLLADHLVELRGRSWSLIGSGGCSGSGSRRGEAPRPMTGSRSLMGRGSFRCALRPHRRRVADEPFAAASSSWTR